MEEGSLLQEALDYMKTQRDGDEDEDLGLKNELRIDLYDLTPATQHNNEEEGRIARLQRLAGLATDFNKAFQESRYPWIMGGDGPVFGIHVSDGLPHLRASCRYKFNVVDEWMAIQLILTLTRKHTQVAVDCWDLDDGPVLLIECANELPDWLEHGELDARHVCWILDGQVTLIGPAKSLSLREATGLLETKNSSLVVSPSAMQLHLQQHLNELFADPTQLSHRAALLLPRPLARLLRRRPELAPCLASTFEQRAHSEEPRGSHEDWVWSTLALPRTHYAMLRTLVTPIWRSETHMPPSYKTAELKRLQRTCKRESNPHLKYAWQVGMRLTAGVDYALASPKSKQSGPELSKGGSMEQRRLLHGWQQTDQSCGGNGQWLLHAWKDGPNHARHDVTSLLQCPVYQYELMTCYPCPLSHPGETLQEQVKTEITRNAPTDESFIMPRAEDVDGDEWLKEGDDKLQRATMRGGSVTQLKRLPADDVASDAEHGEALDNMLGGFQDFMVSRSGVEGISREAEDFAPTSDQEDEAPVEINPRIFLNMLHTVLKSTPQELEAPARDEDLFFSEEDYAMMDQDDDSSSGDLNTSDQSNGMKSLMEAMDDELRHSSGISRILESSDEVQNVPDSALAEESHVLSNLLQSLEASGGAPGPVMNVLREMGIEPPQIPPEASSDDDEGD